MPGQGALRRNRIRKAQERKERQNAERKAMKAGLVTIPAITKDDLLAFQLAHYGDDTAPDSWFVDADTALTYDPADDDDGLGWYEDGVKRTLTDEQIAMFRHSELEESARLQRLEAEDTAEQSRDATNSELQDNIAAASPASSASSIEPELTGLTARKPSDAPPQTIRRQTSIESSASRSIGTIRAQQRQEVPYDQRHKRKWEDYIDENDPVEGSLTHRRIVRELDNNRDESVDLDY